MNGIRARKLRRAASYVAARVFLVGVKPEKYKATLQKHVKEVRLLTRDTYRHAMRSWKRASHLERKRFTVSLPSEPKKRVAKAKQKRRYKERKKA